MAGIRALTLIVEDPSAVATALREVAGWSIEADFGSFASLTAPGSVPLWLNAPAEGEGASRGIVLHMACRDVDAAHAHALDHGADSVREPTDMDFGERSACVRVAALPGVTIDFSRPLG